MNGVLRRLAFVIWWLGFLSVLGFSVGAFYVLFSDASRPFAAAAIFFGIGCSVAAACWSVCYVLAGSFRLPPAV